MKGPGRILEVAIRHPRLEADRRRLKSAVAVLDAHPASFRGGCPPGELSVAFLTDQALAELHHPEKRPVRSAPRQAVAAAAARSIPRPRKAR